MFTFKTTKPTGQYSSFFPSQHDIKLEKKVIGAIEAKSPYKIRLMVVKKDIMEDKNPNCPWKWVTLKKEFTSIDETKLFLKQNFEGITKQFNLRKED